MARATTTIALLTLLIPVQLFSGPNPVQKITIKGGALTKPIEIVDPALLTRFFYGAGPGNYINGVEHWSGPSFIVDWPRGITTEPSKSLPGYDVEFLTSRTGMNTYRVTYVYDTARQQGYVYLPGEADPRYRENTWLLLRHNEGNWFYAWGEWDAAMKPLLPNAR